MAVGRHIDWRTRTNGAQVEKIFEFYIRTTPEDLWEAITDPAIRAKYNFGVAVISKWQPGARIELRHPLAVAPLLGEGEVLEVDAPRRLVHTFRALWSEQVKAVGPSRVTWAIEPIRDSCRLVLTHDELEDRAHNEIYGGWPMILSGLKTWLESGDVLTTPGSLMYLDPERSSESD